jgi:Tfp pilus assembly protein PilV
VTTIGRRTGKRRARAGFVLLDAIIAIFIGTTVFMAILSMLISGLVAAKAAQQNTVACNCARQILENIRLRRSANVPDGTYSDPAAFGATPQMAQLLDSSASVAVRTQGAVKVVNITVNWRTSSVNGSRKSRVFTGLITARGVAL